MNNYTRICSYWILFAFLTIAGLARAQTVVWSENFDDGNGNNRWFADNGVWQIGTPTVGPGSAHSSPDCAGTGLTANYPIGANSRLIRIQSFAVPAASEYPRLRFWQWYSFASGCAGYDYGVVEIKGTNGIWQAASPGYTGNGGGWTYTSVDLRAYAGQTVQVAFHMIYGETACDTTGPGWYIDDVAFETGTPVFNNPEGFEGGIGDWYAETGTWQAGVPSSGPGAAHTGTNCAATILNGNYPIGANSRLISPPFTVPATNQYPRLRFWQWYSFASGCAGYDYGIVEVKGTNGVWQAVSPQYSGNGGGWTYPSIDLTAYAGQTVQVAFHMVYGESACETSGPGWYIDDIALVTGAPVFNNPEGFEGGIGDWSAETGTWQVGVPTKSGSQAHSGTNCAATVLNANYPIGANSRLISPPFTVPATNQYPRLRFWQWYSFASGCAGYDYGVVEVKGTNGIWQAVSPGYIGNGGGWTYPSIDLRGYAGQTVQVAFHMVYGETACDTSGLGWFIDDISLVTGAPVFNNPEGFEGGIGDWYAETGTWQVGVPTKSNSQAHSGTNCAVTVLNANYPIGANSRFISPPFQVPPASTSPYLRFWQWYSFASGCAGSDYGVVEIKAGTNAWAALSSNYSGSSGVWVYPFFDLTSYGGQTVQLAFHMIYGETACDTSGLGWYVDDLMIGSSGAPVIITPPSSETNAVESTATLSVSASGDQPLGYQWLYNSNAIAGATNTTLTLPNVQLSQSGYYDVVVTNDAGSVTSSPPAFLQVFIAFTNIDIGDPGASGSVTNSNGVYTVSGSGEGTDGTADVFNFTYQPLAGDCEIIAQLQSLQGGNPTLAEAGIMMRQSLDPGSQQVSLSVNESTNVIFRRRLAPDGPGIVKKFQGANVFQGTTNIWLRLMRMGNTFVAHYSTNGVDWQYMWFTTLSMSNQVDVGLDVTAHNFGQLATASFGNVSIGSPTPLSGAWPLPGPILSPGGENWSPAEFQRVGGFEFLLRGVAGDYFTINSSTNLAKPFSSWPSLGTVTNTYGVTPIIDSQSLTNHPLYYGAKKLGGP